MSLVSFAWKVYSNSGPALQLAFIGLVTLGWKYEVAPRLDNLEVTQEEHADKLQTKDLNAQERDILLDDAQTRLDQAREARESLRNRVTRLEQQYAMDHGPSDGDGPTGMDIGPQTGSSDSGQMATDGGRVHTEANGSDDDHLDLSLDIDAGRDAYVHVGTPVQGGGR